MPAPGPSIVNDVHADLFTREEAEAFEAGFQTSDDYAKNESTAKRAVDVIQACLAQSEARHADRKNKWERLYELYHQESLSKEAQAWDVHGGSPYTTCELYASKMFQTIFGSPHDKLVSGKVEEAGDGKNSQGAVLLVDEQLRTEARVKDTALEDFREVGMYGVRFGKAIPLQKSRRIRHRPVSAHEKEGKTTYEFGDVEIKEVDYYENVILPIAPMDFRLQEPADNIQDAGWCGNYDYPTVKEIKFEAQMKRYSPKATNDAIRKFFTNVEGGKESNDNESKQSIQPSNATILGGVIDLGDTPDAGPHITQLARFEWWGWFDLEGDGKIERCKIVMILPADNNTPIFQERWRGEVVSIKPTPYSHDMWPYVFHPCTKMRRSVYSQGVMEIKGKHSFFEDELLMIGLRQAKLEAMPPMEIPLDAGIDDEEMDGVLPGKTYHPERGGMIKVLQMPRSSGVAMQTAEFLDRKSSEVVGLEEPAAAPRAPAVGILAGTQRSDTRLLSYIDGWETYWLKPAAQMFHAYNGQFMPAERQIHTMGLDGLRGPSIGTVSPLDVQAGIRFEPIVGRRLQQQQQQMQGVINFWDRMAMQNQADMAMQMRPTFNLAEVGKMVFSDFLGFRDTDRYVNDQTRPEDMRSAEEEHRAFAMGETPGVQPGENYWMMARAHMQFITSGGTKEWAPERHQRLVDHTYDTIDAMYQQMEQQMPNAGEILQQMMGGSLAGMGDPTQPGRENNMFGGTGGGGAGPAGQTQAADSPSFRRPGAQAQQGAALGMDGGNPGAV